MSGLKFRQIISIIVNKIVDNLQNTHKTVGMSIQERNNK